MNARRSRTWSEQRRRQLRKPPQQTRRWPLGRLGLLAAILLGAALLPLATHADEVEAQSNRKVGLSAVRLTTEEFDNQGVFPVLGVSDSNSGYVEEGGDYLLIVAKVEAAPFGNLNIPIRVRAAGTTADPADYAVADTITIPSGEYFGIAPFTATSGDGAEALENVVLELGDLPSGYEAASSDHVTITIYNQDVGLIDITGSSDDLGEGSSRVLTFSFPHSPGAGALTARIQESGKAKHGTDYEMSCLTPIPDGVTCESDLTDVRHAIILSGTAAPDVPILFTATNDSVDEGGGETVSLSAQSVSWNGPHPDSGPPLEFRIVDPGNLFIKPTGDSTEVRESGPGNTDTYDISLSTAPTADVTITPSSSDIGAATVSPNALTFTPSNWSEPQTVTVTGISDELDQPGDANSPGSRQVTITHVGASTDSVYSKTFASVNVKVVDDDVSSLPKLSLSVRGSAEVTEGSWIDLRVERTGFTTDPLPYTLRYTVSGDYSLQRPAEFIIPAGSSYQDIAYRVDDDGRDEPYGEATFTLANSSAYVIPYGQGSVEVTIEDSTDTWVGLRAQSPADLVEGSTQELWLFITRPLWPGASLTVNLTSNSGQAGAATRGVDYTLSCPPNDPSLGISCSNLNSDSGSVTFVGRQGQPATCNSPSRRDLSTCNMPIILTAVNDGIAESGGEAFNLGLEVRAETSNVGSTELSDGYGGRRLTDQPASVSVEWTRDNYSVLENNGPAQPVLVVTPAGPPMSLPLIVTGVTATRDVDFFVPDVFEVPGSVTRYPMDIRLDNNDVYEGDETLTIAIDPAKLPPGVTLGDVPAATVTLLDYTDKTDIQFEPRSLQVAEGTAAKVDLVLSKPALEDASVTVNTADSGATGGDDYQAGPYVARFGKGDTRTTLRIPTTPDSLDAEGTERFVISIQVSHLPDWLGSRTSTPVSRSASIDIVDAPSPTVQFAKSAVSVTEGATAEVPLVLSGPVSTPIDVAVVDQNQTALNGDYLAGTSHRVRFQPGQTRANVKVPTRPDSDENEGTETFLLIVTSAGLPSWLAVGTTSIATVSIEDVPTTKVQFVRDTFQVAEGNAAQVGLELSNPVSTETTVSVSTWDAGARAGQDYRDGPHSVTFPAGETRATLVIPTVADDRWDEGAERFRLDLRQQNLPPWMNPGTRSRAHVEILDVATPTVYLDIPEGGYRMVEGGDPLGIKARLSHPVNESLTLQLLVSCSPEAGNLPCASPGEYIGFTGQRVIPPGGTDVVPWVGWATSDQDIEGEERLRVYAFVVPNGAGVTTGNTAAFPGGATVIVTDDVPDGPRASFASDASSVEEGDGATNVAIQFSSALTTDVTIKYAVGGTAKSVTDFNIENSGTLQVAAGESAANIPVTLIDDDEVESDYTVTLTLTGCDGDCTVWTPKTHTLTITDDDVSPSTVSLPDRQVRTIIEGDSIKARVAISPVSPVDVTVWLQVDELIQVDDDPQRDPEPNDFIAASNEGRQRVVIPAGQAEASHSIPTVPDRQIEFDGEVRITLLADPAYSLATGETSTLARVHSDDGVTQSLLTPAGVGDLPEGTAMTISGRMLDSLATGETATLHIATGGTATLGVDYTLKCLNAPGVTCHDLHGGRPRLMVNGPSTQNIGLILEVVAIQDSLVEGPETVSMQAGYGSRSHVLTIVEPPETVSVEFVKSEFLIKENNGPVQPVLAVSPAAAGREFDLHFLYTDGTATAGKDYFPNPSVTVSAIDSRFGVEVKIDDNNTADGDRTFTIAIDASKLPDWVTVGDQSSAVVNILEDDDPATQVSIADAQAEEGRSVVFTIRLDGASPGGVSVAWAVLPVYAENGPPASTAHNDPEQDVLAGSGRVRFAPGEQEKTIYVNTVDDSRTEKDERFSIVLESPEGVTIERGVAYGTILDND